MANLRLHKGVLIAGLAAPGLGSLLRGRLGEAALALWGVAFLVASALVDLAVWNGAGPFSGGSRQFDLIAALARVPARPILPPTVPVTLLLALAVHLVAAWGAARIEPGNGHHDGNG